MKSGIVYGSAAMLDGMIARVTRELGEKPTVVATGGLGPPISQNTVKVKSSAITR